MMPPRRLRFGLQPPAIRRAAPIVISARIGGATSSSTIPSRNAFGAGDEVVSLTREEGDGADTCVVRQGGEAGEEFVLHRARYDVDGLTFEVEHDGRNAVGDLPGDGGSRERGSGRRHYGRSSTMANPIPPCAHTEMRPNWTSRRRISFESVVTRRPPVAPNGCPIAIAPPMTLMMSSLMSHPFAAKPWRFESTCEAKASCISMRPRSFHCMPARSSALGTAQTGACNNCQPGSTAATAYERMNVIGSYPRARAASALIKSTAEAPSVRGEAFAAVTLP